MDLFSFIGGIFKPAVDLVDELHTSTEEKGQIDIKVSELKNKLAEIEAKVATKGLELQMKAIESNNKLAVAEQRHGNLLSKSWRPLVSLGLTSIIILMGFEVIPMNELIIKISGGFLGIYGIGRSVEKRSN